MDVLISGAGVAGPSLAWWLLRDGHRVTIVEKAPGLRPGGYVIDFWGKGYDLAESMGLLPRLEKAGYHVKSVRFVGAGGRRIGGFDVGVFDRATRGRFISLPRGELSRALFDAVKDRCKTIFGDAIARLEPGRDGASVLLEKGGKRTFDLVVGAEGVHSRTRELVFGPEAAFERFLGYGFAAFTLRGYPERDPDVYTMYGEPGRQAARFTLRGGSTLVLLIWRDERGAPIPRDEAGQRALVRDRFAGAGWETAAFLEGLDAAEDLYVDRVSQIRLDRWHEGAAVLVGDAAFAPSFLAGQGSALAMLGGYVLAGELKRSSGDVSKALPDYQRRLFEFMRSKQDAAIKLAPSFVPGSRFGLLVRSLASRLLGIGPFSDFVFGRSMRDEVELPDYG